MDIIYLSSSCSEKKFYELRESGITRKLPQAQKYHNLLMEGISKVMDGNLYSISAIPTNSTWTRKIFFSREEEKIDGICYIYGRFFNLPVFRQLTRKIETSHEIKRIHKQRGHCVIICDVLNQSMADAARKCGKKLKVPVIGIVTDVPGHTSGARRKTYSFLKRKIAEYAEEKVKKDIGKYDAYLLLTKEMNEVVNKAGKPYIVLEGHCDSKMAKREARLELKNHPKVAMYAGGIHKEFGIERLVNAFVKGNFQDWELHIYGDGNYQTELKKLVSSVSNVKYFGVQPNVLIVENQLRATLLLNPRLTDAEYVKYSFPSKTLECMVSGTPLCTTKLPGMPHEYFPYLYFFEDETENGMLNTLRNLFVKNEEEYYMFGMRSRKFVLEEKNNVIQAKKLLDFINNICK